MGTIGTVDVALLVLAVTQGVKALFGVEGKANMGIAFGVGLVSVAVSHGIGQGLIPAEAVPYIEWGFKSVAGAFSAIGVYDFGKRAAGMYREANGK